MTIRQKSRSASLFAWLLAAALILIGSTGLFAAESDNTGEEETAYTIQIVNAANNGNGAYGTIRIDINGKEATKTTLSAKAGDQITVTPTAAEGYILTQIGYAKITAEGEVGSLTTVSAKDHIYSFQMPAANIKIGAAFQNEEDELILINNKIGGDKNTDYWLYTTNHHAFFHTTDKTAASHIQIDKRYLDIEDVTMRIEIRQYNTGGYTLAGAKEYSHEEWIALCGTETISLSNSREGVAIPSAEIPLTKELKEGWSEYAVVQLHHPSWFNALGDPAYHWAYTNDARILAEGAHVPQPIVWLYNLDENTHRGSIIRNILTELNITAATVNSENLGQNIGYLVDWEGYEPVKEPYRNESYDVEYMLMGNLTDYDMDVLLNEMAKHNVSVNLKSVPTAWTASKTFVELFDIMAEESEVIRAAFALDEMIYDAEALTEEEYGNNPHWNDLQKEIENALIALGTDAEESPEGANLYYNARDALREIYLLVTGKTFIGDHPLELTAEKQEDGTYIVSAAIDGLDDATLDYSWNPADSEEERTAATIRITAAEAYKVKLTVKGNGHFYGELSATLLLPAAPAISVTAQQHSISVAIDAQEEAVNTPTVLFYTVELYKNDVLLHKQESATGKVLTFGGLDKNSSYTVKASARNIVGNSTTTEKTVQTKAYAINDTTCICQSLVDIDKNSWYHGAVDFVLENGIMKGIGDNKFAPHLDLSRAMMAQILYNLDGEKTAPNPFRDVKEDAWYRDAVGWAASVGLVEGYNGCFRPEDNITRQELAVMLYRYAALHGLTEECTAELTFSDADRIADWAGEAITWCVKKEVINGRSETTLDPLTNATRAEAAKMLRNLLTL